MDNSTTSFLIILGFNLFFLSVTVSCFGKIRRIRGDKRKIKVAKKHKKDKDKKFND